jgi:DMSO/TMAO reductase YedYZ molybdopterin-dependent catalytic subunit
MRAQHLAALVALALFAGQPLRSSWAAAPSTTATPLNGGIVVAPVEGAPATLTAADVTQLPSVDVHVSFDTEHGPRQATFSGPLLWTVLDRAHAIDPGKPRDAVRQTIVLTGQDGYTAVLALGEIAPAFENKQVIVAVRMDNEPLAGGHLRVVVPGDTRGGRSVRDVVRIAVMTQGAAAP